MTNRNKSTLNRDLKSLFKNKYWFIVTVYCILYYILMRLTGAELYYILDDTSFFSIISLVKYLPAILVLLFITPYVKRYGKRNTALLGALLLILSSAIKLIDPPDLTFFCR